MVDGEFPEVAGYEDILVCFILFFFFLPLVFIGRKGSTRPEVLLRVAMSGVLSSW